MMELCDKDMPVYMTNQNGDMIEATVGELLPLGFFWKGFKLMTEHKSGFVSIIGRPNVGKSTFVNRVIGHKIAIMSDKAQTTRNKIQGVMTRDDAQIIFIDTPGIHKPKHKLEIT